MTDRDILLHSIGLSPALIGLGAGRTYPSRFTFVADEMAAVETVQHVVSELTRTSSDEVILLVEDEPDIREIVQALLEWEGLPVVATADGPAAVAWAEGRRPALVVLDLGLPFLDGVAVATILRERYGELLPILVFSADVRAREKTRHLGPCGLVRKPFDADVLVAEVRRGLDGS